MECSASSRHLSTTWGNFCAPVFIPNSMSELVVTVSVVFNYLSFGRNTQAVSPQKTTFPKPLYGWQCHLPSILPLPPPSLPLHWAARKSQDGWRRLEVTFPPLQHDAVSVERKRGRHHRAFIFCFSFSLLLFYFAKHPSHSASCPRPVGTSSSGVDASNHAGDPCQKLTAS